MRDHEMTGIGTRDVRCARIARSAVVGAAVLLLLGTGVVGAQSEVHEIPIQPGPMSGSVVFLTLVGPPEEGVITNVTVELQFTTAGSFDAGNLELELMPPVEPHFPSLIINGAVDFGWSGTGTFSGSLSTTALNGHMLTNPLMGMSIWNLDIYPANFVGGVSGDFGASRILVEYIPGPPSAAPEFTRGDANDDGLVNIADAIFTLATLFPTGDPETPVCLDAADANDDGTVDIADAIAVLGSLFGTPATPLPGPALCGTDATDDTLDCPGSGNCP